MIARIQTEPTCHRGRAAFAGFTAGYVMALAGYWLQAVFGVSELAFAHSALRYVSGGKQGWWVVGIIFHLIDSVLLGLLFATRIYPNLPWLSKERGSIPGNIAAGVTFATGIWLVMAMSIAMPFMGAGIFARKTRSVQPALASLSLHLIFGTLLGYIYGVRDC